MAEIPIEPIADALLLRLRRKSGEARKLSSLEKMLEVDRQTLEAAIQFLADCNYRLKKRKDTITFVSAPDSLIENEITYGLTTRIMACRISAYKSVKSTNDIAMQIAEQGAPEGALVIAEQQTEGRGRFGRAWHSPPGTGIYLSVILRPNFSPDMAPGVSIMTAIALADTLSKYCPEEVQIKWPNDVLIGGKKTAGILTELNADPGKINHIVIGVGINVNQGVGAFPEEIRHLATSVRRAVKRKVNRVELLKDFLRRLEREYFLYQKRGLSDSINKVRKYSLLIGKQVSILVGSTRTTGRAIDIEPDGSLLLDIDGKQKRVTAGEVTILKKG
jgi:BirA family biotin operon repressor/biotin-[acetyl-CoA-carboxylase] ligase